MCFLDEKYFRKSYPKKPLDGTRPGGSGEARADQGRTELDQPAEAASHLISCQLART